MFIGFFFFFLIYYEFGKWIKYKGKNKIIS